MQRDQRPRQPHNKVVTQTGEHQGTKAIRQSRVESAAAQKVQTRHSLRGVKTPSQTRIAPLPLGRQRSNNSPPNRHVLTHRRYPRTFATRAMLHFAAAGRVTTPAAGTGQTGKPPVRAGEEAAPSASPADRPLRDSGAAATKAMAGGGYTNGRGSDSWKRGCERWGRDGCRGRAGEAGWDNRGERARRAGRPRLTGGGGDVCDGFVSGGIWWAGNGLWDGRTLCCLPREGELKRASGGGWWLRLGDRRSLARGVVGGRPRACRPPAVAVCGCRRPPPRNVAHL